MGKLKPMAGVGLCLMLSFCTPEIPTGNLCSFGPFITDKGAVKRWTKPEKRQLVARNNAGVEICGWKKGKS